MRFLFFIIFFSFINTFLLYPSTGVITIQSCGISVIEDKIDNSRKKAIDNAIINGIKKITDKNIDEIKKDAVIGYEILNETIEGNILKEQIKLLLNEKVLNKILNQNKNIKLVRIVIKGYENNNISSKITDFLEKIIKNIHNFNIICVHNFNKKDVDFILEVKALNEKIKELKTVNKIYAKVSIKISLYNKNMEKLDELNINKNIIYSASKFYLEIFQIDISNFIEKNIKNFIANLESKNEDSKKKYFFMLNFPKNFKIIDTIVNIFELYNIKYSWYCIEKNRIIFIIRNLEKDRLVDILKTNNFYFNYKIQ